jgi:cell division protein FtsB
LQRQISVYKLIVFLLILIAALQYRLWLGDGGIREFHEINQRIDELKHDGEQRKVRNAAVAADVRDLRDGIDAIEERARHELGMIKSGETYVQIYDTPPPRAAPLPETPQKSAPATRRKPKLAKQNLDSKPRLKQNAAVVKPNVIKHRPKATTALPKPR